MGELTFSHGLYYPDSHEVPLSDIAATLLAHEQMLPIIAATLENLYPGLKVEDRKIFLDRVERSSLKEAFFVALFLAFQEDLEREVPALIEASGVQVADRFDTSVTVLFMVALYYGTNALFGKKKNGDAGVPVTLSGDYATYVNLAGSQLGKSSQDIREAVEKAVGKRHLVALQRSAIAIFRPAKRGGNGRIIPLGLPEVSSHSVADFPTAIALAELDDDTVPIHLPRVRLDIRATDRDKADKGWAAKIRSDEVNTKRLPLRLAPGVDPVSLAEIHEPEVEAFLESRVMENGATKPLRIHVFKVFD